MELINNRSERLNRVLETIHVSSLREQRIKFQIEKETKQNERVYLFSRIRKSNGYFWKDYCELDRRVHILVDKNGRDDWM